MTGHRIGDNNQVLALAELLGWPFEDKRLTYRSGKLLSKLISRQLFGITLAGIKRHRSSKLEPPWPDVIISAGRDNEPVARWVRKKSGGRTRLVHLGRPWAPLRLFDLIITTPQYSLPSRRNILEHDLPLHRVTPERLQQAKVRWQPVFAHLQRPYTVVLVGGNSGSFVFTQAKARILGQQVNELAVSSGGSVLISNSARTPEGVFDIICQELTVPAHIHHWGDPVEENPYLGYLALADRVVVTGESTSMLTEASVTGKPMFIFDLSNKSEDHCYGAVPWWRRWLRNLRYRSVRHWLAIQLGPRRMYRDIGNIQRRLVHSGRAFWLGHRPRNTGGEAVGQDARRDERRIVDRVRGLFLE